MWGLLLLLLAGCRYTFWPVVPAGAGAAFPERLSITGELRAEGDEAVASLKLVRVPRAGYLVARWYAGNRMLLSKAVFIEQSGNLKLKFPLGKGYRQLVLVWERQPVLQLSIGVPRVPPRPTGSPGSTRPQEP